MVCIIIEGNLIVSVGFKTVIYVSPDFTKNVKEDIEHSN